MSNVVTISQIPPERGDAIPWVTALMQESPDSGGQPSGTWTLVATIDLAPYDADPANPALRTLTTTEATQEEGWYRVIWQDGTPTQSTPSAPVQNTSELAGGVRPSVAEVASHIRARTKVRGGSELGTFTPQTRPTAEQAEDEIDDAIDEVLGKVQYDPTRTPPDPLGPGSPFERRIRRAVAMYAAISIELSYFPEQVRSGQSPAQIMQGRYESRIKALIAEGETGQPQGEGSGGSGGDAPADAAWSFPDAMPGAMVGWSSRW